MIPILWQLAVISEDISHIYYFKYEKPAEPYQAENCHSTLVKAGYDWLSITFKITHDIAKQQKTFLDYNFLCKLDRAKGFDIWL